MLERWLIAAAMAIALQLFVGAFDPDFHEAQVALGFQPAPSPDIDAPLVATSTPNSPLPTILIPGTTIVPQPYSPAGLPKATPAGTNVGADGQTTTSWMVTRTTTLLIPTTPPAISCATWTVKNVSSTILIGGGLIIIKDPIITSAFPGVEDATTTVTEYFASPSCPSPTPSTVTKTVHAITTSTVVATSSCSSPVGAEAATSTITVVSTTTAVSTTTLTASPVTVTTTVTPTLISSPLSSVSHLPTQPIGHDAHSTPQCHQSVTTPWTAHDIHKGTPFIITFDDSYGAVLKIRDAGRKTEKYTVDVDGGRIGSTSDITPDFGEWCGNSVLALDTCAAKGTSHGEFNIPPGKHRIGVANLYGIYDTPDTDYSTIFYSIERTCGAEKKTKAFCIAREVVPWTIVDVRLDAKYNLPGFEFDFPTKLTIVDAGYRTEKYSVSVDGVDISRTHDYITDWNVWCGESLEYLPNCLNQGMSQGISIIPSGKHSVLVENQSTGNPSWLPWSPVFYKVDAYCEE